MPKPILYLARGEQHWVLTREIADRYDVRAISVRLPNGLPVPRHFDIEVALKAAQHYHPEYTIRIANWYFPKVDWLP